MLKKTAFRSGLCLLAFTLGACSMLKQPAAPTETGGSSADSSASVDNPYGTAPYTPPSTTAATPTYAPPASSSVNGYVPNYSPVDINAATHTVEKGDTVYNVAKRFQISQDNLRAWNNLADNNIHIGQVLRVKPAGYVAPAATSVATAAPVAQVSSPVVVNTTPVATASASTPTATVSAGGSRTVGGISWQLPTSGAVLQNFGGSSKGIDFGGNAGQAILAAAAGKVVYAGSGLRGYGNLVIIQHNQTYLTAYGHNQSLMVKEGQEVKRGQQIATMGSTDAKRTQLHFELRENGTPMDPRKYLPM
ncbi:peptidoglycan DD-metalloendopeptidase family protein [Snodgrassella sp. CFCC 13594]|uniref:peptidoglycan DD-metalloendopeptidase family protein n=1 Tax=Snodgrassella sp. CFCC 13594 TaxID=1775559 RepID=UPI00082E6F0B|nr:peptidoglycan DD-metalloendopeptidase family protein [Snodgrassella sp. CFCC 13594]